MLPVYEALYRRARFFLIAVVTVTVIWTSTDRFTPPARDRFVDPLWPGNADFYIPWAAARALKLGFDPYLTPLGDPWNRKEIVDGKFYYLLYPPAMITLYLPLALYTDDYFRATQIARVWHFGTLLALAWMIWAMARLVRRSLGHQETEPILILVVFCCLAICPHVSLALERGQSDITIALLCWAAVVLFLYKYTFCAVFLATAATAVKGYPVLFGAGLGLLALLTQSAWRAIAGAGSSVAILLFPVRNFLEVGFNAVRFRSNMTCYEWRNYAFSQFIHQTFPDSEFATDWGRLIITGFCALLAMICLVCALRSTALGRPSWVLMFSVFSLTALVGYSTCGYIYSFIMLAPGILAFLLCAPELLTGLGLSRALAVAFALLQAIPAHLMFHARDDLEPANSATADGLVYFILLNGSLLLIGAFRRRLRLLPHDEL